MTEFGRVLLAMGGDSSEADISREGARAVAEALRAAGIDLCVADGMEALKRELAGGRVRRVFNLIHGSPGEDGVLQGYLEACDVPYTGSGVLGAALSMDKERSKQVWRALGLPVAPSRLLRREDTVSGLVDEFGLPLVIKPAREGSSVGVHILRDTDALARHLKNLDIRGQMVEGFIDGEEYTVGILQGEALPVIHIEPAAPFYDYQAKYVTGTTRYHCPCGMAPAAEQGMQALALQAFHALDCAGWGRVDLIRDRQGRDWLLEVNTTPGMTKHSLVPKAAAVAGLDFNALVLRILETSEVTR